MLTCFFCFVLKKTRLEMLSSMLIMLVKVVIRLLSLEKNYMIQVLSK